MDLCAAFCDLCYMDGDLVLAVGDYQTDEGNIYDACDRHMQDVAIVAGDSPDWHIHMFDEKGGVDET